MPPNNSLENNVYSTACITLSPQENNHFLFLLKIMKFNATGVASFLKIIFNNGISIYHHSSNEDRIKLYL